MSVSMPEEAHGEKCCGIGAAAMECHPPLRSLNPRKLEEFESWPDKSGLRKLPTSLPEFAKLN